MSLPSPTSTLLIASSLALGAVSARADTFNDFSGTGANTAFTTETTNAEWALNSGAYRNTFSNTAITPSSASVPTTGVAGNSFTLESQFTVQQTGTINNNGATLGFGFFASSSTFSTTANSYYLADLVYGHSSGTDVGRLRIVALGDTSGFTGNTVATNGLADADVSSTSAITVGTTYTLRLQGTYAGNGTLSMTFGLFDAAGTTQIGTSASAIDLTPLAGTHFGYRNRIGLGGGTSIIDFDNFAVSTIPEPSAFAAFGGLAALGFALQRRRRA